ncbi:MAG TPA: FtsX-like permease family protein [Vicinamibacterales bacterium]|jgi:ABC-type lipoprotein release transport system permease subunit
MTLLNLAAKNFLRAGAKAWLRVAVLSLAFVVIIGLQGMYQGIAEQTSHAMIEAELGGGQYWQPKYDPQDLLTLSDAHGPVPSELTTLVDAGQATPILVVQGYMYSKGSLRPVLLKGIDPAQRVLSIPAGALAASGATVPALIGTRMASEAGLKEGDIATVRWRDAKGTFDAEDFQIVRVMSTSVQSIDSGQVWLPLETLRQKAGMPGEASLVVLAPGATASLAAGGTAWTFKDLDFLLADVRAMIRTKEAGASIIYLVLIFLAMIAILDTQVLSIFYRKKEIGTLMALGLTRGSVIRLFTLEGALNAVLAAVAGAVYGIPLLALLVTKGIPMPAVAEQAGYAIGERIYPTYSAALVIGTTALVGVVTTVVSYLPTRKIATLQPTEALRGRLG